VSTATAQRLLRVLALGLGLQVGLACRDESRPNSAAKREPPALQQPPPSPTGFSLQSRPTGASLFVDGVLRASTPAKLDDVSPGQHVVRLELSGYRPWEAALTVADGLVLELPRAELVADSGAMGSLPPLPEWSKSYGIPPDLLIVLTDGELDRPSQITILAHDIRPAEVTVRYGERRGQWCTFAIESRRLKRFGWNELVDRIEDEPPPCDPSAPCAQRYRSLSVSVRAFGRTLTDEAAAAFDLASDIRKRVYAVLAGSEPWPRDRFDAALGRFDVALSSCLRRARARSRSRAPDHTFEFAIAKGSDRARLISVHQEPYSKTELGCIEATIEATRFPRSETCEVHVDHDLPSWTPEPSDLLLNPYRR
jgi:PEGA domain